MTNGIVDGHLNVEDHADRPLSGIMSTTSSRPSTSATIVHVHSQPPVKIMPAVHQDPSIKRAPSSVVFHENPTSYHTIIKVLTRLTPMHPLSKTQYSSIAYPYLFFKALIICVSLMTNSSNLKNIVDN